MAFWVSLFGPPKWTLSSFPRSPRHDPLRNPTHRGALTINASRRFPPIRSPVRGGRREAAISPRGPNDAIMGFIPERSEKARGKLRFLTSWREEP
jgi:hypothetical protein